jgi:hypothetical protein
MPESKKSIMGDDIMTFSQEQAVALGFPTVQAAIDHLEWLKSIERMRAYKLELEDGNSVYLAIDIDLDAAKERIGSMITIGRGDKAREVKIIGVKPLAGKVVA